MNTLIARIIVLALLTCCSRAWAGIVWEKTEIEVTPKKGEAKISVPFFFDVEKGNAVQILDVGSSCGCTTTTIEKRLYAPGESGVLDVVFTPGLRQGRQNKQIVVKALENGKETQTTLTLFINLPELTKTEVTRLEWTDGDESTQTLKIETKLGVTLSIKPIASLAAKRFKVELKPDKEGLFFTLIATPLPHQEQGLSPVLVDVFSGEKRLSTLTFFLLKH